MRRWGVRHWPAIPLGLSWLMSDSPPVSDFEQMFIIAAAETPYSLLLVEAVTPGWSLTVRDLFTGRAAVVVDPEVSCRVSRSHILLSGVVTLDGVSTLLAPAAWTMPAEWCFEAEDMRRVYSEEPWQRPEELIGVEWELFDEYEKAMDRPSLVSVDGDPGGLLHLEWTLSLPFEPALERLRPLCLMDDDEEYSLEARPDGSVRALMTWYERQSREADDHEPTAHLFLDEGWLSAEVSACRRARLEAEIERRFGVAVQLATCRSALPVRIHERQSRFLRAGAVRPGVKRGSGPPPGPGTEV